jgi:hypothetical protein
MQGELKWKMESRKFRIEESPKRNLKNKIDGDKT